MSQSQQQLPDLSTLSVQQVREHMDRLETETEIWRKVLRQLILRERQQEIRQREEARQQPA